MEEFAGDFKSTKKKSGLFIPDKPTVSVSMDNNFDKDEKEREEYNKNILNIDSDYANFQPNNKVLVRCRVLEYIVLDSGIAVKPSIPVAIRTQNGVGIKETQESPYPYSVEAVVVAVPENYEKFSKGDVVVIPKGHTLATKENTEVPFHMPRAFMLPEWSQLEPPTDIKNKHYGYLLVEGRDILGKIKK